MFEWLRRLWRPEEITAPLGPKPFQLRDVPDDPNKVRDALAQGKCPDCGGDEFYDGPCGGLSQNIQCANEKCGSKFNVAFAKGYLMIADRIG